MDYRRIYQRLVEFRKCNPLGPEIYGETHHIIPTSLGGTDEQKNLVKLSAREHYICHLLLTRFYPVGRVERYKMVTAFLMMLNCRSGHQKRFISNRLYEKLKLEFAQTRSQESKGEKNTSFGTKWISNDAERLSRKVPVESELPDGWFAGRVIDWDKYFDRKLNPVVKAQWGGPRPPSYSMRGKKHSEESKKLMRDRAKARNEATPLMWISNEKLGETRRVPFGEIPNGWRRGRPPISN